MIARKLTTFVVVLFVVTAMFSPAVVLGANDGSSTETKTVSDGGSIQAAIDDANDTDTIIVESGTYEEQLTISKNITLEANGSVVLKGSTFGNGSDAFGDGPTAIYIPEGSNAAPTIDGFTISDYEDGVGLDVNQTSTDWALRNVTIRGTSWRGVYARASQGDWEVRNVTVTGANVGIDADSAWGDWKVTQSSIQEGIGVEGEPSIGVYAGETTGNWTIRDSEFIVNDVGVRAWGTGEMKIVQNEIQYNDVGVNANRSTAVVNASYNWWGSRYGPSGDFPGGGDAAFGDLTVHPYYVDSDLTTLTITVTGQLRKNDSDEAVNDIVMASQQNSPLNDGIVDIAGTNSTGHYSLTIPPNEDVVIRYFQLPFEYDGSEIPFPRDSTPDMYALELVNSSTSTNLGTQTLPEGYNVNVTVMDENRDLVPGANVYFTHVNTENGATIRNLETQTNVEGMVEVNETRGPGIELRDEVIVRVTPPEGDSRYVDDVYVKNRTVTQNEDFEFTLAVDAVNLSGTLHENDSSPAANDTLIYDSWEGDHQETKTNSNGEFNTSLVPNVSYEIKYWQGNQGGVAPADNVPDYYTPGTIEIGNDKAIERTLPPAHNLTVNVIGPDGSTVSDAKVHFNLEYPETDASIYDEGLVVGNDGEATRELIGTIDVHVDAPAGSGLTDAFERVDLTSDDTINLTLHEGVNSTGQLFDSNEVEISGGQIEYDPFDEEAMHTSTEVNETGHFSDLIVTDVEYGVGYEQPQSDGQYPNDGIPDVYAIGTVNSSSPDLGAVTLPKPHNLTVHVTNESGAPVSDASVSLNHERGDDGAHVGGSLWTNEDGMVEAEVLGEIDLYVNPPSDAELASNHTALTVQEDDSVHIVLSETTTVSGKITDANDERAHPVRVHFDATDGTFGENDVTSEDGYYSVNVTKNKTYEVDITQEDLGDGASFPNDGIPGIYQYGTNSVGSSENLSYYQLPYGHDLNITIKDESGALIENADVHVGHINNDRSAYISGTTNTDGLFVPREASEPGIEVNGTIRIDVEGTSEYLRTDRELTVNESRDVTVTVQPAVQSSGRIIEPDDTGAAQDYISFHGLDEQDFYEDTWTDNNGNFTGTIGTTGEFGVGFVQTPSDDVWQGSFPQDGVPDVYALGTVNSSSPDIGEYQLPTPHNLTVEVTDESGNPIPDAEVHVSHTPGELWTGDEILTDDNGEVRVEVVGEIDLDIRPPADSGFTREHVNKYVDSDDTITVELSGGQLVSGTIKYADGTAASGYPAVLHGEYGTGEQTNETGAFEMLVASNNTYQFGFDQRDWDGDESFPKDGYPDIHVFREVTVGNTAKDLGTNTLPEAHLLQMQVVDENNDPVAGVDAQVGVGLESIRRYHPATTNESGYITLDGATEAGIEANGSVEVQVHPTESGYPYATNETLHYLNSDKYKTVTLDRGSRVEGQVKYADGTNATEQKIRLNPRSYKDLTRTWTDGAGYFAGHVQSNETVDVGFYQVSDNGEYEPSLKRDGRPDIHTFGRFNTSEDVNLKTKTLPEANVLNVQVIDESGDPVSDAKVNINHRNNDGRMHIPMWTNEYGQMERNGQVGIEVNGTVDIAVEGMPDRKLSGTYTSKTIESDQNVTLVVHETEHVYGTFTHPSGASPDYPVSLYQTDPLEFYSLELNETGVHESYAPANESYWLAYHQRDADLGDGDDFPRDGRVDMHTFEEISIGSESKDLGHYDIPEANLLHVKVTNQSGGEIADVPVEVRAGDVIGGVAQQATTNESGYVMLDGAAQAGIEVNGTVEIVANPADADLPYRSNSTTVTVNENQTVELRLNESPSLSGQIYLSDGETAAKDDMMWTYSLDSAHQQYNQTDQSGLFELPDLIAGDLYNLAYYQGYPNETVEDDGSWESNDFQKDGSPDMYALGTLTVDDDRSMGETRLPNASLVDPKVVNESGDPVEAANVTIYQFAGDHGDRSAGVAGWVQQTATDGKIYPNDVDAGLELVGNVTIMVVPPEDDPNFVDENVTKNITVGEDDPRTPTIELAESTSDGGDGGTSTANVSIQDASLNRTEMTAGEKVKVNVTLENTGDADGNITLQYYRGDSMFAENVSEVPAGHTRNVTVIRKVDEPGTHTFWVNDVDAGELTVEEEETTTETEVPGMGPIAALLALLSVAFVAIRRRH